MFVVVGMGYEGPAVMVLLSEDTEVVGVLDEAT